MDTAASPVTSQAFRDVIGRFATGVTVVTSRDDGGDHGMTASAVSSLSLDPPMLLVCINQRSRTGDAIRVSGRFTVNVLAEHQAATAQRFATPAGDRFADVPTARGPAGTLLLDGCLAHIVCHVEDAVAAATHHIIIGRVERVAARDGAPLTYFRGQFGQLHPARDDSVTQCLRERVLSEDGGPLDREALATELDADIGRIDRALMALRAEGLVAGDPVEGYRVAPVDIRAIDDALTARLAIELGALELAADFGDARLVAELRRRADSTVALFEGDHVTDINAYATANTAFHEELARLGGSLALLDSYRRLSLQGIIVRGVVEQHALSSAHAHDHVEIAEGADQAAKARLRSWLGGEQLVRGGPRGPHAPAARRRDAEASTMSDAPRTRVVGGCRGPARSTSAMAPVPTAAAVQDRQRADVLRPDLVRPQHEPVFRRQPVHHHPAFGTSVCLAHTNSQGHSTPTGRA